MVLESSSAPGSPSRILMKRRSLEIKAAKEPWLQQKSAKYHRRCHPRVSPASSRWAIAAFLVAAILAVICGAAVWEIVRHAAITTTTTEAAAGRLGGPPLAQLGLLTDIQYADVDDGFSAIGVPRHYRYSLSILDNAMKEFRQHHVDMVVNLGDLVDRINKKKNSSLAALSTVLERQRSQLQHIPLKFVLGNHDVESIPRHVLHNVMRIQSTGGTHTSYYDFEIGNRIRGVVLDVFEISLFSKEGSTERRKADSILQKERKGVDGIDDNNLFNPNGLSGLQRRFVALNGAFSTSQLKWLDEVLRHADRNNEIVIIFSHVALQPGAGGAACGLMCLPWNYADVAPIIQKHKSVKVVFAGHDHAGGYKCEKGVHHVTLQGIIETKIGDQSFGRVEIYDNRVDLIGHGRLPSRQLRYGKC